MKIKIILINPFLSKTDFETPLGITLLATHLKKAGFNVDLVDLVFNYDLNYFEKYLEQREYDIAALYAMSTSFPYLQDAVKIIKARCANCFTVAGGPHVSLFAEEIIRENDLIDAAIKGEAEWSILELCSRIRDEMNWRDIPNLVTRDEDGGITNNPNRPPCDNLDEYGWPDRDLLPTLEGYMNLFAIKVGLGNRGLNLIASRGCRFNCSYCQPVLREHFGSMVRYRSTGSIIDEMVHLSEKYNVKYFWFEDDTLTMAGNWLSDLCDILIDSEYGFKWSCNSRIDTISEAMIRKMKEAGCYMIRYGFESGSQYILDKTLNKGVKLEKAKEVVKWTRDNGIKIYAYMMIGGKEETVETVELTRDFIKEIRPFWVQISMTTPLPGTYFRQKAEEDPEINIISDDLRRLSIFRESIIDTPHFTHKELERIHDDLINEFHFFNPLLEIRSFHKFLISNFRFFIYLVVSQPQKRGGIHATISYILFAMRAFLILFRLRKVERLLFKRKLSFPPV